METKTAEQEPGAEREIEDGPVGLAELGEVEPEDLADVALVEAIREEA